MRKVESLILISILILILSACRNNPNTFESSKYLGTWTINRAESEGLTLEAEKIGWEFTIILNADGTATLTSTGEDPREGTWEETENGITLHSTDLNDGFLEFTLCKDELCYEEDSIIQYFEKIK